MTRLKDCTCTGQFASSTTFQRFANGRKDSYRNAASEIY